MGGSLDASVSLPSPGRINFSAERGKIYIRKPRTTLEGKNIREPRTAVLGNPAVSVQPQYEGAPDPRGGSRGRLRGCRGCCRTLILFQLSLTDSLCTSERAR